MQSLLDVLFVVLLREGLDLDGLQREVLVFHWGALLRLYDLAQSVPRQCTYIGWLSRFSVEFFAVGCVGALGRLLGRL